MPNNTTTIHACGGNYLGHRVGNGDFAAMIAITFCAAADASTVVTIGFYGTACNRNVAAVTKISTANACRYRFRCSLDIATLDDDIAASTIVGATNGR